MTPAASLPTCRCRESVVSSCRACFLPIVDRCSIIFIIAYPEEQRLDALAAGADQVLRRALDGAALIDCIEKALKRPLRNKSAPSH